MVVIQEVDNNGAADPENSRRIKEAGNSLFRNKDYKAAVDHYAEALKLMDGDDLAGQAVLHSNSAACYIQLYLWDKAINEATNAINLDCRNVKAYHRKATALKKKGHLIEAVTTLKEGIAAVSEQNDVSPLTKLLESFEKSTKQPDKRPSSSKRGGFLDKSGGLFSDTPRQTEGDRILSRLKESISFSSNGNSVHIEGVFQKLLDRNYFEKTVFPGLTPEQRQGCPRSLRELLDSPMYSEALENEAVPEAMKKARSVLENVKRRGAEAGDFMDAQTEATLWPQVVNEALARAIVSMVQRIHRRQHLALSRDPRFEATTPMPEYYKQMELFGVTSCNEEEGEHPWGLEQLDDSVMEQLVSYGFGALDEFMGDDWPTLILDDAIRLVGSANSQDNSAAKQSKSGKTKQVKDSVVMYAIPVPERSPEGMYGEMAWLPPPQLLQEDYPALAEIVSNLHALPFELNRLFSAQSSQSNVDNMTSSSSPPLSNLRLTRAMPSATALLRLKPGNSQPMRIDCDSGLLRRGTGESGGEVATNDSGYRITALYFLPCPSSTGGELRLRNVLETVTENLKVGEDVQGIKRASVELKGEGIREYEPLGDRLMLWRSDVVGNERALFNGKAATGNDDAMYAILFWMHGVEKESV